MTDADVPRHADSGAHRSLAHSLYKTLRQLIGGLSLLIAAQAAMAADAPVTSSGTSTMTTADTPAIVNRLVDVVNRGDTEAFLALFTTDGEVDDWGRRFASPATMRAWSDDEFIGKKVRLAVTSVTTASDHIEVIADVTSEAVNGPTRFDLFASGDRLRELRLRPTGAVYAWLLDVRRMFASPRR